MSLALQWYFGPFCLDSESGCLWRDGELIALSPKPSALLAYLAAHAGEVVTKEALLDAVWPETMVSEGVLKTYMGQIRQALGETARAPQFIETIPRRGYRFIAPVITETLAKTPVARVQPWPGGQAMPLAPEDVDSALSLVGRDAELAELRTYFDRACQGERQLVCVTGEAGIGKTALVDAFAAQVSGDGLERPEPTERILYDPGGRNTMKISRSTEGT